MAIYLVVFSSTHAALALDSAFPVDASLIPVHPSIRAGCGMGLRFVARDDSGSIDIVERACARAGLSFGIEGVYRRDGDGWVLIRANR